MEIFVVRADGIFTKCSSQFLDRLHVISNTPLLLYLVACLFHLFLCCILRPRSLHPWQLQVRGVVDSIQVGRCAGESRE